MEEDIKIFHIEIIHFIGCNITTVIVIIFTESTFELSQNNYKKEVTKQMDTWLDAVRNIRNYCAHPSMVVGMTSSVVISDNRDSADVLPDNTNLYSRLYALKKILPQKDADMLARELEKLISKTKIDIYKMNVLPANWKELYDKILFL